MSVGSYSFLPRNDALRWFKVLAVFRFATCAGEQPGFELPPDRLPIRLSTAEGNANILLIDDQDLLREAVSEYLGMHGYQVTGTESGWKAMKLLEEGLRPDLLLCDVMLPDIRGGGFVREAQILLPEVKVLFMSGYGRDAVEAEIGEAEFLQKPFRLDMLVRRVQAILAERVQ